MFVNTIFFALLQFKDYKVYDAFALASIISADTMIAIFILSLFYLAYRVISFFKDYPKLSENLKTATDILLQEDEYNKLVSSNVFLF